MIERGATVGVIGVGAMGGALAGRLLERGWSVLAYDPAPAALAAVVALGAETAESPEAVAARADVVLTSLPGEGELREVLFGRAGDGSAAAVAGSCTATGGVAASGRGRCTVVDLSTILPAAAVVIAAELQSSEISFIDAPVSGGPSAAAAGSLTIMAGGAAAAVDALGPLFSDLGTVFHCGGPGAGQICKACNQLIVIGTIELVAETLVLAASGGLDPAQVRAALLGGYASSRVLELHGARMLSRDFEPGGKAKFNLKDIDAISALANACGLRLPAFEAAAQQLQRLLEAGGGELDNSALITVLQPPREEHDKR